MEFTISTLITGEVAKEIRWARLQNSPYFCVFKDARAVKQKVCNKAENKERDWGETLKIRTVFFSRLTRPCFGSRLLKSLRISNFFFVVLSYVQTYPTTHNNVASVYSGLTSFKAGQFTISYSDFFRNKHCSLVNHLERIKGLKINPPCRPHTHRTSL